jgi:hypothetical protein
MDGLELPHAVGTEGNLKRHKAADLAALADTRRPDPVQFALCPATGYGLGRLPHAWFRVG